MSSVFIWFLQEEFPLLSNIKFPYYQKKKKGGYEVQNFDNGDVSDTLFLSLDDTQLIFAQKGRCHVNRFAGGTMLHM